MVAIYPARTIVYNRVMDLTKHFRLMLQERKIRLDWFEQTILAPDRVEDKPDGTRHFIRCIADNDRRWLRVIVNTCAQPHRAVTVFFDRRLRREPYED
jgi:hypothetical protein